MTALTPCHATSTGSSADGTRSGMSLDGGVSFRVLGPLKVWRDGKEVDLGPEKQRALLAVLLLNCNETVPRADIVDAMWGEHPPGRVVNVIQAYVSRLRRVLEPGRGSRDRGGRILTRGTGYQMRAVTDELDLLRFRGLVTDARSEADRGQAPGRARRGRS